MPEVVGELVVICLYVGPKSWSWSYRISICLFILKVIIMIWRESYLKWPFLFWFFFAFKSLADGILLLVHFLYCVVVKSGGIFEVRSTSAVLLQSLELSLPGLDSLAWKSLQLGLKTEGSARIMLCQFTLCSRWMISSLLYTPISPLISSFKLVLILHCAPISIQSIIHQARIIDNLRGTMLHISP